MVKEVETKAEFDAVLKDNVDKLVAVDFTATWCGPCRAIGPKFAEMEKEFPGVIFCKVDVDKNSETSEAEGINAMPTFKFYKGGKKVDELIGADETKLREKLEKHK